MNRKKLRTFSFQINCKISTMLAAIFLITCCNCQRSQVRERERERERNREKKGGENNGSSLSLAHLLWEEEEEEEEEVTFHLSFWQLQRRVKSIQNYWQQFMLHPTSTPPSTTPRPPPKSLNQGRPLSFMLSNGLGRMLVLE